MAWHNFYRKKPRTDGEKIKARLAEEMRQRNENFNQNLQNLQDEQSEENG